MEGISALHLILTLLALLVINYLIFAPVLRKAGFSPWWSILMTVPLLNLVLVWIFAFIKWPAESGH